MLLNTREMSLSVQSVEMCFAWRCILSLFFSILLKRLGAVQKNRVLCAVHLTLECGANGHQRLGQPSVWAFPNGQQHNFAGIKCRIVQMVKGGKVICIGEHVELVEILRWSVRLSSVLRHDSTLCSPGWP